MLGLVRLQALNHYRGDSQFAENIQTAVFQEIDQSTAEFEQIKLDLTACCVTYANAFTNSI